MVIENQNALGLLERAPQPDRFFNDKNLSPLARSKADCTRLIDGTRSNERLM
jgi:hypothetical protein